MPTSVMLEPLPVLFVDDDESLLKALRRIASHEGWEAVGVADARAALAQLEERSFSVVVSDYLLPKTDGVTLLAEVRKRWPDTERILMTASSRPEAVARGVNDAGISRFISKPWRREALVAMIDESRSHSQMRRERAVLLERLRNRTEELGYLNERLQGQLAQSDLELISFRRRWDVALDAISDPLVFIRSDYCIEGSNRAARELTGSADKRLEGRTCHEAMFGSPQPCAGCPIATGTGRIEIDRGAPAPVVFDARAYALPAEAPGYLCIYRDVSSAVAFQREAAELETMTTIGRLASGVLHELNNPLQAVLLFSHLAADQVQEGSQLADTIDEVRNAATRCRQIVESLRHFVRSPEAGEMGAVDLGAVLDKASFVFSGVRGKRLEWHYPDTPLWCHAEENGLQQIIVNAVQNALDASPVNGLVKIAASREASHVVVRVDDAGPGIPPEQRALVMQPFYSTKPASVGTGLGLFLARMLLMRYGGSLNIGDSPLGGARLEACLLPSEPQET